MLLDKYDTHEVSFMVAFIGVHVEMCVLRFGLFAPTPCFLTVRACISDMGSISNRFPLLHLLHCEEQQTPALCHLQLSCSCGMIIDDA